MQLATDAASNAMTNLSKKLGSAKILLNSINSECCDATSHSFCCTLRRERESFPSASLKFSESKKQNLQKLNQAQKIELKLALEDDISPLLAEAKEAAELSKLFLQEELPADPDECVLKLDKIKSMKELEIERLNQELEDLELARFTVETIQEIKRKAAYLDDAFPTSTPNESGSSAKKPKFG